MELAVREMQGQRFVEGVPGKTFLERGDDVGRVLEVCFEHEVGRVLLYSENLPKSFFDLSSGDAGTILQKLRNYHVRLAVVRAPTLQLSRRFSELLIDEQHGLDFRLFDTGIEAQHWLCST
jgi:hypothetical protein